MAPQHAGKLRYCELGDPRNRELSGFPALERAVWGKLADASGDLMVLRVLSELQRGLSAAIRPLAGRARRAERGARGRARPGE